MKLSAFLVFAASTLLCATLSQAAPCSSSDVTSIASLPEFQKLSAACGTMDFATATTADAASSAFCKSDCIAAIEALAKVMPKCESGGVSLSAAYDSAIKTCKGAAASSPASAPAAATPAPAKSSDAATNSASVAVGAVAVVLALARA